MWISSWISFEVSEELGPSACAGNFPPVAIQVRKNELSNPVRNFNRIDCSESQRLGGARKPMVRLFDLGF
jgi:hypothetical protein